MLSTRQLGIADNDPTRRRQSQTLNFINIASEYPPASRTGCRSLPPRPHQSIKALKIATGPKASSVMILVVGRPPARWRPAWLGLVSPARTVAPTASARQSMFSGDELLSSAIMGPMKVSACRGPHFQLVHAGMSRLFTRSYTDRCAEYAARQCSSGPTDSKHQTECALWHPRYLQAYE